MEKVSKVKIQDPTKLKDANPDPTPRINLKLDINTVQGDLIASFYVSANLL